MALNRIGRFEISGELGRGGMSIVYRGVDPVMQRATALKVIRKEDLDPAEAPAILERFKREAQAAGSLHHPNIVAIYEYGEDETFEWIAMELVEGRTLRDHLLAGWRPDLARLPSVLEQLLEALDYSHGRGVVHRDVKPGNVLVSDMGVAKMSDFGIARVERSHLTQKGEVLGTPSYMAPEQYEGGEIDERTDIYSAGVIVYEVLCGRRPFDGEGGNLMRQILQEPPPPASNFEPRLPITIDMVLGIAGNVGALRRALGSSVTPESAKKPEPTVSIPAPVAAPAKPSVRKPAVLFVDDEERVLNALSHLFRDTYDVETANGGAQALERLAARRFHVLVSDQRMPGMIGVELLRQAKGVAPGTVRLLLTGYSDLAAIVGSVNESEVFRFVSKPWQEEDLRATIAEAVDVAIAIEAAAAGPVPALPPNAAVLVLGDAALARAARELANKAYKVSEAATVEAALEILAAEEVAALVCDLDLRAADPGALLRVLKKQSPQTQLITVTETSDSETIIRLINEARIYRFLKKPVNFSLLQNALLAALSRYARLARSPSLLRTESAKAAKRGEAEQSILGRLKSLGGRFAAAFKR
jgi:serine/threonine-protein kinase